MSFFRKLSICRITLIVHPLPNKRYICVSEQSHLYQSGTVCSLEHSIGVNLRIDDVSTRVMPLACDPLYEEASNELDFPS